MLDKGIFKSLFRIGLALLGVIVLVVLFIRYQGFQYWEAYTGEGFAHELPLATAYPISDDNRTTACSSGFFKVLTFNIEYGSELIETMAARFNNGSTGGALPWSVRAPEIRTRINGYAPDLIGFQETHTDKDIGTILSLSDYSLLSYHMGSFQYGDAALAYRGSRFEILDKGQLWLGPHPDLPMSYGFKPLAMLRYVNWAVLKEKATGFTFMFVNTHFDNAGGNKEPSATLFYERITQLAKGLPLIVTGDFNTTGDTERYRRIIGADKPVQLLQNAYVLAGQPTVPSVLHPDKRIDHILAGGPCHAKVDHWFIDPHPLNNGERMSDHLPILARVRFTP